MRYRPGPGSSDIALSLKQLSGRHSSLLNNLLAVAAIGLMVGGCSNLGAKQASLCVASEPGAPSSECDGPKVVASLTLPRADLLRRVEIPASDTMTTASTEAPSGNPPAENAGQEQKTEAGTEIAGATPASPPSAASPAAPQVAAPDPAIAADADSQAKESDKSKGKKPTVDPAEAKPGSSARKGRADTSAIEKIGNIETRGAISGPQVNTLKDAVRRAIADHPLIGLAGARVTEAIASIGVSESALYPQIEGRAGAGPGIAANYQSSTTQGYFDQKNAFGSTRGEASIAGKQILFDFGAIRSDVARSTAIYDSETLKLREQTESISGLVSDVYLKILEQRELYAAAAENLKALEKIVKLVEDNEKNGNGTVADMKRVRSRLIDGQSNLADAKSELQTGTDKFIRLVRLAPGTLRQAPSLATMIPKSPDLAIAAVPKGNPRIQALEATLRASKYEIDAQKASVLPKVAFESDIGIKEYRTRTDKTEVDAKGLITLKYKFFDGGLQSKQLDQLNSRYEQGELRKRNEMDDIEADIRKQYRVIQSARSKSASLADNVVTSEKARQLYDEQFRGGKRTLLELLDIQTTYYTTRRTAINNRYEEQRAINSVLIAIGGLTEATLAAR